MNNNKSTISSKNEKRDILCYGDMIVLRNDEIAYFLFTDMKSNNILATSKQDQNEIILIIQSQNSGMEGQQVFQYDTILLKLMIKQDIYLQTDIQKQGIQFNADINFNQDAQFIISSLRQNPNIQPIQISDYIMLQHRLSGAILGLKNDSNQKGQVKEIKWFQSEGKGNITLKPYFQQNMLWRIHSITPVYDIQNRVQQQRNYIQDGDFIEIKHLETGMKLRSFLCNYKSGSENQEVTCSIFQDNLIKWQIFRISKNSSISNENYNDSIIQNGDQIMINHIFSQKLLITSSESDYSAPSSRQHREVSCSDNTPSEYKNQAWIVRFLDEQQELWQMGTQFALQHKVTGALLLSQYVESQTYNNLQVSALQKEGHKFKMDQQNLWVVDDIYSNYL